MKHLYSLVHLTNISCPPPEMIRVAARAGYDAVSLRTIPMGLPGERPYDIAKDPHLLRETRRAAQETGILLHDTENARIAAGVDVQDYEPALAAAAELGIRHILTNIWTRTAHFIPISSAGCVSWPPDMSRRSAWNSSHGPVSPISVRSGSCSWTPAKRTWAWW